MDYTQRLATIGESPRTQALDQMEAWYNGNAYSVGLNARSYNWDQEKDATGKRIPIEKRKPKQYNLARYIVDTTAGWLFGIDHFPGITAEGDEQTEEWCAVLSEAVKLPLEMLQAAKRGGKSGTAVMVFKVVEGFPRIEHLPAKYCTPTFGPDGESLKHLLYQYKAPASHFVELGYEGLDSKRDYWHRCEYTDMAEIHYLPVEVAMDGTPPVFTIDEERTVTHNLEVLAAVWIKNLPSEDPLDGESSYAGVVDLFDPINTLLSVAYRSIKKLSDPTLGFENIEDPEAIGEFIKLGSSSGGTLVSPGGLKLLEMSGSGQEAAKGWMDRLRQAVGEISRCTSPDPEKLSGAAQSALAMRILYAPLIELVGELRLTYGPALVRFVRLMLEVVSKLPKGSVFLPREASGTPNPKATISLKWGDFFQLTPTDVQAELATLLMAVNAKFISLETAQARAAWLFDVEDVEAERERIEEEKQTNPGINDLIGAMDGQDREVQPPSGQASPGDGQSGGQGGKGNPANP